MRHLYSPCSKEQIESEWQDAIEVLRVATSLGMYRDDSGGFPALKFINTNKDEIVIDLALAKHNEAQLEEFLNSEISAFGQ